MGDILFGRKGNNMKNEWQLKIDLMPDSLDKIEILIKKELPSEFKEFLSMANASCPKNDKFEVDSELYVLNNILNFNDDSEEGFNDIYIRLKNSFKIYIPFARDGFGNYLILDIDTKKVFLFNHENEQIIFVAIFEDFINSLF